jgi:hypothetical protein
MDKATLTMVVSSVVGGILMALQGVTLHQAGAVQEKTERVGEETSTELAAIYKLQESSAQELAAWGEIRESVKLAMSRQEEIRKRTDTALSEQQKTQQALFGENGFKYKLEVAITQQGKIESNEQKILDLLTKTSVKPNLTPTPTSSQ